MGANEIHDAIMQRATERLEEYRAAITDEDGCFSLEKGICLMIQEMAMQRTVMEAVLSLVVAQTGFGLRLDTPAPESEELEELRKKMFEMLASAASRGPAGQMNKTG